MGKAVSKNSCIEMHITPSSHFKSLTAKTWHACGCQLTPEIHPNTLTDHAKPDGTCTPWCSERHQCGSLIGCLNFSTVWSFYILQASSFHSHFTSYPSMFWATSQWVSITVSERGFFSPVSSLSVFLYRSVHHGSHGLWVWRFPTRY